MVQQKVCPVRGEYAVMNRQELLAFFLEKRRENINFCKNCKKDDCYSCNRFLYIRDQLEKNAFFTRDFVPKKDPMLRQPVLWQVFDDLKKKTNDKNEFKFRLYIEKKVFSFFLVKKYNFVDNKIIEIYN